MKYLLILIFLIVWSISDVFSLTGENIEEVESSICSNMYEIRGEEKVQVSSTHEYKVYQRFDDIPAFTWVINYTLLRDNLRVEEVTDTKYLRNFKAVWDLKLEAILSSMPVCDGKLVKNIRVYSTSIIYLWEDVPEIETGMKDVFEKNSVLFLNIPEKDILKDELREELSKNIASSDILIIGSSDLLATFTEIAKIQKWKSIDFSTKKIYIRSDYSRQFLSKILASSLSQIWAKKAFLITKEGFYWLITRLSSGIQITDSSLWEELSYEKNRFVFSLWAFLQYLSYSGFSYSLIAFLLVLTTIVLILNIMKQIVWLNVFGIYYPILFAIVLSILWPSSLTFIAIWFLSIILVNLFTRKVHLLINAKRALLISLYIVLFFFLIGIDNFFELQIINYSLFNNNLIIFPIFIAVILADKIFQDDIQFGTRVGFIDLFQYVIITGGIYFLLQNKELQYFLVSYPDSIIAVVILNILVGRYMWLQLLEYFRFSPLLRKSHDQEE